MFCGNTEKSYSCVKIFVVNVAYSIATFVNQCALCNVVLSSNYYLSW